MLGCGSGAHGHFPGMTVDGMELGSQGLCPGLRGLVGWTTTT